MRLQPDHLCCPCSEKSEISANSDDTLNCANPRCPYGDSKRFYTVDGIPILLPFGLEDTVCAEHVYEFTSTGRERRFASGQFYLRRNRKPLKSLLKKFLLLRPRTTQNNLRILLHEIGDDATILVIGSASEGGGTEQLWSENGIAVVGTDIYPSASVDYIADAHYLPFKGGTFDGVVIQAVLEHVLEPVAVVSEIYRVLKDGGIVYAETPFMQQVHEGAYDFQRFTVTGHRWLFRRFEQIDIGTLRGPAIALAWSLKHLVWALTRSRRIASLVYMPAFFVLQFVDLLITRRFKWDGASGVYFLGRKVAGFELKARDVVDLYGGAQ